MIRIVVLVDSMKVSAWVWETISQTMKEKNVRLVLAVINLSPKPSGKPSPLFYRLYRAIDRRLFLNKPDAFATKELEDIPGWDIPVLHVRPIQKKYVDILSNQSLQHISSYEPDLILRFGFRILKGEILNLAPLGVWSFHHGDNRYYRGGPPCFWEVMNQEQTTGIVLQRLNEKLDDGLVLSRAVCQTDPLSVQRNANKIFWISVYMIPKAIRELGELGIQAWNTQLNSIPPGNSNPLPILTPPDTSFMAKHWAKLWTRNSFRKMVEYYRKPYWEILVAPNSNPSDLPGQEFKFKKITPPKGRLSKGSFWADPFPMEKNGQIWVFFEEFDGRTQKGKIALGKWDGENITSPQPVLTEDWHLSYPFIWEEEGIFYLIPESGEAGKTYLYRAKEFPLKWERLGVLKEGEAFDPTVLKIGDRYWLFVNQRVHSGASPFVGLYAYHSPSLENPSWTPHTLNPIVTDVRASRPAGRIFEQGGKLYRPAQDSGKRYGHRIKIQEILILTETAFAEKTIRILEPAGEHGFLGTHTFNFSDHWIFSDAFSRR